MTKRAARTVANVVMISAGVAAAYVVFTTPPLRALAGMASRRWLGASLPVFLIAQTRRAWAESGERPRREGLTSLPDRASVSGDVVEAQRAGRSLT